MRWILRQTLHTSVRSSKACISDPRIHRSIIGHLETCSASIEGRLIASEKVERGPAGGGEGTLGLAALPKVRYMYPGLAYAEWTALAIERVHVSH